jgi:peptidoglycan/xylan/chitin deacetylase (PgdA/CDA1 family)
MPSLITITAVLATACHGAPHAAPAPHTASAAASADRRPTATTSSTAPNSATATAPAPATSPAATPLSPDAAASPSVVPTTSYVPTAPLPLPAAVASMAGKDITRLPTMQHVVALTFDAGANANAIPEILATLSSEHVTATFFLTGAWVKSFPAQARQIGSLYPVGNHSLSHPDFRTISSPEVEAQVTGGQVALTAATGHSPRPLFRFPYGGRDPRTRRIVNGLGYISVLWTIDTRGWQGTSGGQSVALVTQRVMANLGPGEIVLMHVGSHPTDHSTLDGDALRTMIDDIKAKGYGFVTIPQGLGIG